MLILPIHSINPSASSYKQKNQQKDSSDFRQIFQKARQNLEQQETFQNKIERTTNPAKKN